MSHETVDHRAFNLVIRLLRGGFGGFGRAEIASHIGEALRGGESSTEKSES